QLVLFHHSDDNQMSEEIVRRIPLIIDQQEQFDVHKQPLKNNAQDKLSYKIYEKKRLQNNLAIKRWRDKRRQTELKINEKFTQLLGKNEELKSKYSEKLKEYEMLKNVFRELNVHFPTHILSHMKYIDDTIDIETKILEGE
ncbi:unnamed protein product, partial [Didymodactylos carnosus]